MAHSMSDLEFVVFFYEREWFAVTSVPNDRANSEMRERARAAGVYVDVDMLADGRLLFRTPAGHS